MRFGILILAIQCISVNNERGYAVAKPMVGENVRKARENEFPPVVSIMLINKGNKERELDHECTGVLISKRDVLTAAHCFDEYAVNQVEIIVGTNDLRAGMRFRPLWWFDYNEWAKQNKIRPRFDNNDIGIIRLRRSVPENISPVILSSISRSNLTGERTCIVGWGRTITGEIPRFMETVELKVLSKEECESKIEKGYGSKVILDERYICSDASPFATLNSGDSGGPLFRMGTLIGINKSTCPYPELEIHPAKVNIHFSIDFYRNFILDVKQNYN